MTTPAQTTAQRRAAIRVTPKEPDTLFDKAIAWYCRRTFGQVLDNALVMMHHRKMLTAVFGFERKLAKWDRLDPDLKVLAELTAASRIGCSWCMDFGWYAAHSAGLDTSKLSEVPTWRDSTVFTDIERRVMEYAERVTATPPEVPDELAWQLRTELGDAGFLELTMMIAVENERSRFNHALGLTSQGFKDHCELQR